MELWKHQVAGINKAMEMDQHGIYTNNDLGLFFEQGTGKTRTMIEILRRRYAAAGRVKRTLILCPIIVCENWRKEIHQFSKLKREDVYVLTGSGVKRAQTMRKINTSGNLNRIIITNYEAMEMREFYNALAQWGPEIMVCDESQRLKNPQSKRARAVMDIAETANGGRFILTGTPILQSPMDLFMQFRILDDGQTFGKNWYAFRNAWFHDENSRRKGTQSYFPKWVPRPEMDAQLTTLVRKKAMRVLAKDCLDLPPLIRQVEETTMGTEQAKAYGEMLREYLTFVDSQDGPRAVVAQLAVVKALRLQQIVTGFVKDETGQVLRFPTNPRLDRLKELLEELTPNNKVIIWSHFKENHQMIGELCVRLRIPYREIHGDISHKAREQGMDEFRNDPSVKVMIANQGAGGVGVNLVEAKYAIYYSKGFKLEDDLQSRKRNHRGGSEMHDSVIQIDLVTRGTIDELVNEALENKVQISDRILSWRG
jgi:SNF2 family DNA or RNA helicase